MGLVGMLLAALIIGFLVMTNTSLFSQEGAATESNMDSSIDQAEVMEIDTASPSNTLDSVEQRVDELLQSSEDKYRDLDQ